MKKTDIIRKILDLIDSMEDNAVNDDSRYTNDDESARFRQIFNLLSNKNNLPYVNCPDEKISDIDSVTVNAGGGYNGPKHPDDIRIKDPRGYE